MDSTQARQPIKSYEDLEVYQRSLALVKPIDDLVQHFPSHEERDLVQQMRRASKSVPTNIAEGFSRRTSAKDFKLFLAYAMGSANEMNLHLNIAMQLGYVGTDEATKLTNAYDIVGRQLNRLIQSWRQYERPTSSI